MDSSYAQLYQAGIVAAHQAGYDGTSVILGLMDGGLLTKHHEALVSRTLLAEHDFVFQ